MIHSGHELPEIWSGTNHLTHEQECVLIFLAMEGPSTVHEVGHLLEWLPPAPSGPRPGAVV